MHVKRVCKYFEVKILAEYYDLHVQNDTLLLADVFNNFLNMSTEIYGFDSACLFLNRDMHDK